MDISHFFNGQYEVASDEYHFSISNDGTYYLYEISDKNSNLIRETDKQNGVVKNKNGEFYYKDYDDNGNRVLNYCNGKNLLKVADYSEEDYFKLLNKDYYVLWNFDNKNYSIVHNGKIVENIDTDVSKMDLFVNYPSKKLIGIKEYKKDDSLEDNYSNITKDAYLIDIINNKSELLMKGISSHFNFYNEYMSFNKDEVLDNSISEGYENLGSIYLFNGKDLKMIIDEPCHYGWDYFKGTEDVLNFEDRLVTEMEDQKVLYIIIQKVMNL